MRPRRKDGKGARRARCRRRRETAQAGKLSALRDARAQLDARPACPVRGERAQAMVEMVVVVPVLVVLALIVYNLGVFAAAVARFDRLAPDIVMARAVSAGEGEGARADIVRGALEEAMAGYGLEIEVVEEVEEGEGAVDALVSLVAPLRTYRCTMRYAPWPSSFSIAGVSARVPAFLSHERAVTVDVWRSGVVG